MSTDIELKNRILNTSDELFNRFGFNKVTMNEISGSIGISKKTLYKFFDGKEQIVREIIHNRKCNVDNYLENLWADENLDFVEKMTNMMNFLRGQVHAMKNPLIEDLKKNNPEIWKEILETKKENIREKYSKLIGDGIKEGWIRDDLYEEVVMLMYINSVHNIMTPEVLSELPMTPEQVFDIITSVLFQGMFTDKGKIRYQQYLHRNDSK
jgi:AcrR family transcriptional regulator